MKKVLKKAGNIVGTSIRLVGGTSFILLGLKMITNKLD